MAMTKEGVMMDRKGQLSRLYSRIRELRADAIEIRSAEETPADAYVAAMEREARLTRLLSIIKHRYRLTF